MMNRTQRMILIAAVLFGGLAPAWRADAQLSFTPLGRLPGQTNPMSFGWGISGDGYTVVGEAREESSPGFRAPFRWTAATGMEALTSTAPGASSGIAYAASYDGAVIVGVNGGAAFRWTQATGPEPLPAPPGGIGGAAHAISPDAQTIVGFSQDSQFQRHSARWTSGAPQFLGDLPGWMSSSAQGVSASGDVIVGNFTDGQFVSRPFRWTVLGSASELPLLPGYSSGSARTVSGDGLVAVGQCFQGSLGRGVRWIGGTVQDIGVLPGETSSGVQAMTEDGTTIVGLSGNRAFLWTETGGMVDLLALLLPVMPPGWSGFAPSSISDDGTVIAGYSANPATGTAEAVLVTIPTPGGFPAMLILTSGLLFRRYRR